MSIAVFYHIEVWLCWRYQPPAVTRTDCRVIEKKVSLMNRKKSFLTLKHMNRFLLFQLKSTKKLKRCWGNHDFRLKSNRSNQKTFFLPESSLRKVIKRKKSVLWATVATETFSSPAGPRERKSLLWVSSRWRRRSKKFPLTFYFSDLRRKKIVIRPFLPTHERTFGKVNDNFAIHAINSQYDAQNSNNCTWRQLIEIDVLIFYKAVQIASFVGRSPDKWTKFDLKFKIQCAWNRFLWK